MDICLCEGADVDEEVKEALEKGFYRLRFCSDMPPLKRLLPRRLFNLLQYRTTPLGATLLDVVRVGLMHYDAEIGAYAPDQYAYDTYQVLFDRMFEDRHSFLSNQVHPKPHWGDWDRIANLDPENKYIISTRVRCARNLDGFRFSPTMSPVDFETVESVIVQMLELLPWEYSGQYIPMQSMTDEVIETLIEKHLFFLQGNEHERAGNVSRFWPMGRGVFFNNECTFGVWINEKDHLRAIAIEPGGNLREAYKRVAVVMPVLDKRLPPATHDRLGYLTVCPGNVGCALRLSVLISMPNAPWDQIVKIAKVYRLEVDEIEKQVFCISNKRSLGYSEYAVAMQFTHGTREMIKLQMTHEVKGTVITDSDDSQDGERRGCKAVKALLMQSLLAAAKTCDPSTNTCACTKGRVVSPRRIAGAMSAEIEFRKINKMSISKSSSPERVLCEMMNNSQKTAGGDTIRDKPIRSSIDSGTGKIIPLRRKSSNRESGSKSPRKDGGGVSPLRGVESSPVAIEIDSAKNRGGSLTGSRGSHTSQKEKTDQTSPQKSLLNVQKNVSKSPSSLSQQKTSGRLSTQSSQQNNLDREAQQKSPDRTSARGSQQKSPDRTITQSSQQKGLDRTANGSSQKSTERITSQAQKNADKTASPQAQRSQSQLSTQRNNTCPRMEPEGNDDPGRKLSRKFQMSSKAVRGSLVKIPNIRSTRASSRTEKKSMVDYTHPEQKKDKKSKKNWKQMLWV